MFTMSYTANFLIIGSFILNTLQAVQRRFLLQVYVTTV